MKESVNAQSSTSSRKNTPQYCEVVLLNKDKPQPRQELNYVQVDFQNKDTTEVNSISETTLQQNASQHFGEPHTPEPQLQQAKVYKPKQNKSKQNQLLKQDDEQYLNAGYLVPQPPKLRPKSQIGTRKNSKKLQRKSQMESTLYSVPQKQQHKLTQQKPQMYSQPQKQQQQQQKHPFQQLQTYSQPNIQQNPQAFPQQNKKTVQNKNTKNSSLMYAQVNVLKSPSSNDDYANLEEIKK